MSIPPPPSSDASLDEKLQFLIQSAVNTQCQFTEMRTLLQNNQVRVAQAESKIVSLEAEVKKLKESVNSSQQQAKLLTVRLLGLSPSDDEINGPDPSVATAKLAYDRILRPILNHAKTNGKISSIPSLSNTITKAFRTSKLSSNNSSPPIIIQLASAPLKTAIFSSKRDALPPPSAADKANGAKRISLSEDLTADSFQFLKALRDDKRVSRAWSVDGHIRYIAADDNDNVIRRVKSIYDSLDSILSK
jgi:hypothetical protein